MTKTCAYCKIEKDISEFRQHKSGRQKGQYMSYCKTCNNKRQKEWKQKNTHRNKRLKEKSRLKTTYGITLEDYNVLFIEQQGCCAVCGRHQSEFQKSLCVDHNHGTGDIRGLLCVTCNFAIGSLQVDTEGIKYLQNAIQYIEERT
jgi:hypothetical protein